MREKILKLIPMVLIFIATGIACACQFLPEDKPSWALPLFIGSSAVAVLTTPVAKGFEKRANDMESRTFRQEVESALNPFFSLVLKTSQTQSTTEKDAAIDRSISVGVDAIRKLLPEGGRKYRSTFYEYIPASGRRKHYLAADTASTGRSGHSLADIHATDDIWDALMHAMKNNEVVIAKDVLRDDTPTLPTQNGSSLSHTKKDKDCFRSFLAVPLATKNKIYGVIIFDSLKPKSIHRSDAILAEGVAKLIVSQLRLKRS